jgi:hypothetical protein
MDFTWDNKSGPLDPTSPFYKFATMKRMSKALHYPTLKATDELQ